MEFGWIHGDLQLLTIVHRYITPHDTLVIANAPLSHGVPDRNANIRRGKNRHVLFLSIVAGSADELRFSNWVQWSVLPQ